VALTQEWFTAAEVAALALPGVPTVAANVIALAERENWRRPEWLGKRWRKRTASGGGVEYHWSVLPPDARLAWSVTHTVIDAEAERQAAGAARTANGPLWDWFFTLSDKRRDEAARRLQALEQIRQIVRDTGRNVLNVRLEVAAAFGATKSTLYNWEGLVRGQPRIDWLALLAPRHVGRVKGAECSQEAWDALYVEYMRPAAPTFSACYRKIKRAAEKNGWTLPSESACLRRMQLVQPEVHMLNRRGADAVKRMFPAQERDRTVFRALEAVNADGHKWDVFVKWPDGHVGRPMMVGFQDLYSDLFLSWRVDRSENRDLIRLAFGDMIEQWGVPKHCYLDNGRGFASKQLTGGTPNRYRFKYREQEPDGIMTQLGVEVHWTTPYAGQSKPIERGFGDLARDVARDIRFEGAYTGNSPMAKPENYGSKAVPLELFLQVVAEGIREHNARVGRRTRVCKGVLSFQQAFDASYAKSEITKATLEQRRLWLLAAEGMKPRKPDGSIILMGNRFCAPFLTAQIGKQVTVRFDPEKLQEDMHVFRPDGIYLGAAPCVEAVGFNDVDAARAQMRARAAYLRAVKSVDEAHRKMTAEAQIALTATNTEAPPPPETKVVRLMRTSGSLAISAGAVALDAEETEDMLVRASEARRAHRLRLVGEDDGD